jgi:hypothetical protein
MLGGIRARAGREGQADGGPKNQRSSSQALHPMISFRLVLLSL